MKRSTRPALRLEATSYSSVVGIPIMERGNFQAGVVASVLPRRDRGEAEELARLFVSARDLEDALVDVLEAIDGQQAGRAIKYALELDAALKRAGEVLKNSGRRA